MPLGSPVSPREPHYKGKKKHEETTGAEGTRAYASDETKRNDYMKLKPALMTVLLLVVVSTAQSQTTFTKITTGPIAIDQGQFGSAAWGDFHGLGVLDLVVCDFGGGTNVYYRNNGDRSFAKITQGDPVQGAAYSVDPAPGDFENSGHLGLFVTAGAGAVTAKRNMLCFNNGDGTLTAVSGGGVTNFTGFFNTCAVVDYDNDGAIDIYVPGYGGGIGLLFHNEGGGTFHRVLSDPPLISMNNHSVSCADIDGDGLMDLLVNADTYNLIFLNNRDGTFRRMLTNAVATDLWPDNPWGSAWGDSRNSGLLDLFVTGMTAGNRLYHNLGNGVLTNVTSGPMLAPPPGGGGRACAFGDYNNDGYLDLFVCGYNCTNRLFLNNGDGTFTQVLVGAPVDEGNANIYCQACGWVDYDVDGCLDLFVTRASDSGAPVSNLLYHNDGNTNGWLEVKLVGKASNCSGIGAKIRVHAKIGGKTFWQMREVSSGGGRWIQPLVAHFGLGDATNVDTLRIEWPSGIVQTLTNVAPKQVLTVGEHQEPVALQAPVLGSVVHEINGAVSFTASGEAGWVYVFETSTNLVDWTKLGVKSNATGIVSFTDTKAASYGNRFCRVCVP
jgi:hypothetical protein